MADCTKTVDFLREWKRLFDNTEIISIRDQKAPKEVLVYNQIMSDMEHPERTIKYVQKWSDEHPVMTWAGKLREMIPTADINAIIHNSCPENFFGSNAPKMEECEKSWEDIEDCANCWAGEYKEVSAHAT